MPLIVANNWSAVVQVALYTAVVLVGIVLPAPSCARWPCSPRRIAVLAYQWFVIRTALATTGATALGLVVIDVLLEHRDQPHPRRDAAAGVGGLRNLVGPLLRHSRLLTQEQSPSAGAVCPAARTDRRAASTSRDVPDRRLALADRLQRADDVPDLVVQERARPQAALDQLAVAARHGCRPASSPARPTGIRWSGSW